MEGSGQLHALAALPYGENLDRQFGLVSCSQFACCLKLHRILGEIDCSHQGDWEDFLLSVM